MFWRRLKSIVADPSEFENEPDVRTALYRLFLKVWGSVSVNEHVDEVGFSGDEIGAHRNLEAITLRPRIAFLLELARRLQHRRGRGDARMLRSMRPPR